MLGCVPLYIPVKLRDTSPPSLSLSTSIYCRRLEFWLLSTLEILGDGVTQICSPSQGSVFQLAASFPGLDQLPWLAVTCVAVAERQDLIRIVVNQVRAEVLSSVLLAPHLRPRGLSAPPYLALPLMGF